MNKGEEERLDIAEHYLLIAEDQLANSEFPQFTQMASQISLMRLEILTKLQEK